ncbi:MAG: alpha/beta hydrolase [Deltaproteobacteria bacterium]|nr:alpha/beta hydrolase [Deltaproteobacteria bacterium]
MTEPIVKRAKGDGVEIQLAFWDGAGKTVLCIHGLTANCRCWDTVAAGIAPGHRVFAMDLRGRGLSEKPPSGYSIDHHCRDIQALLTDLGLDRIVLMGHSLGAFISLAYAAKHHDLVDRVILVDGGGKLSDEQMAKVLAGIKPAIDRLGQVFPSFEAYLDLMKVAPFLQPWSAAHETYFQYETEAVEGGIASRVHPGHIQEELVNLSTVDSSQFYPDIRCPVLILRATEGMLAQDDLLLPEDVAQRMCREISNARCADITGTNHYSIVFEPNDVRDGAIREFLVN